MAVIIVLIVVGAAVGAGAAWLLNSAALAGKERERERAVSDLAALATKLDAAESASREARKQVDEDQKKVSDAQRQAEEATRQLADARKDAAGVRAERDEERARAAQQRSEFDREKSLESNPASLPAADLARAISSVKTVRCTAVVSLTTPAPGLDDADVRNQLSQALTAAGLACGDQSPVEIMVLVSLSEDQPRRALGVMLLVVRALKVPGEAMSRQAAVWGQQRTSLVNAASASVQVDALIKELVAAMKLDLATKSAPPSTPPATPPVAPPAVPPSSPPAAPPQPPTAPPANGTP
jgi:hypothetical protein